MSRSEKIQKAIGRILRSAIDRSRLTRKEVAKVADVSVRTLATYEGGGNMVLARLIRICSAVGLDHVQVIDRATREAKSVRSDRG